MAEKEEKDTKKATAKKTTTTKKNATKKEVAKKDEKEVKKPKTTTTSTTTKKTKEEPKKAEKKDVKKTTDTKAEVKETKKDNKSTTIAKAQTTESKKVEAPKGKVTVETKKFEIKNNKKDVSKKSNIKKVAGIIIVIVVIAIVALLTFLIVTSSDPKKSVDGYLTNLKAGEFEKAQEFAIGEKILSNTNYSQEVQKLLFDKMSWKVKNVTTQDNIATVEIEITNKDFSQVAQNWTKRLLSNVRAVIGKTVDTSKYFEEELRNEGLQTKTTTGNIKLEKQNGKWKVVVDEQIESILLPGLENSINYLQ